VLTLPCEHAAITPQPANSAHRLDFGAFICIDPFADAKMARSF
jgi:hypothetical protein